MISLHPAAVLYQLQKNIYLQSFVISLFLFSLLIFRFHMKNKLITPSPLPETKVQSKQINLPTKNVYIYPEKETDTFSIAIDADNLNISAFSLKLLMTNSANITDSRIWLSPVLVEMGWQQIVSMTSRQNKFLVAELAAIAVTPGGISAGQSGLLAHLFLAGYQENSPLISLDSQSSRIVYSNGEAYSLVLSKQGKVFLPKKFNE